jgi:hypothetical protein
MKNLFVIFLVWVVASGCANTFNKKKTKIVDGKISSYNEDLSVFRPKFDKQEEAAEQKQEQATEVSDPGKDPKSVNNEVNAILDRVAERNKNASEAQGYRIQLWAGNSKAEFEGAKGYILQFFPELEIYASYSQPTYRIKVGDFLSKMSTEKYFSSIKSRFSSARIIADKIDLKKSLDLK